MPVSVLPVTTGDMTTTNAWHRARRLPDGEIRWNPSHNMIHVAFYGAALQHLIFALSTGSAWIIAVTCWNTGSSEQWLLAGKQLLAIAWYISLLLWYAMGAMVFFWTKQHTASWPVVAAFIWRRTRWSLAVMGLAVASIAGLRHHEPLLVIPWESVSGLLTFFALRKSWTSWREIHTDGTVRPLHPHPSTAIAPEAQRTIYRQWVGEQWDVPGAIRDPRVAIEYATSATASASRRRTVASLIQVLSIAGLVPGLVWYFHETPAKNIWCFSGVVPLAIFALAVTEGAKAARYDDLAKEYQDRAAKISPDFL